MAKKSSKKRVGFKLNAPEAQEVFLAGSFNEWDEGARPLKKDAKGVWRTRISLEPGEYEYRFIVDGEWVDDPECEDRCENEYGICNCVVRIH